MQETVKLGNTVSVEYTGKLESGEVFDSSEGKEPLVFKTGDGQVIPGFDDAVLNMAVGDTKTVTIQPEDAYGRYRDEMVVTMPVSSIPADITLEVGMMVQLTDKAGNPVPASVVKMDEKDVTLDVNHPLAGMTLIFDIEIVKIEA